MTSFARSGAVAVVIFAALATLTGCGGGVTYEGAERAAVSGTITLDGGPLPYGNILFVAVQPPSGNEERRTASAIIQNGTYSMDEADGPNLAEYRVMITGHSEIPAGAIVAVDDDADDGDDDDDGVDPDSEPGPEQIVPAKYNIETTLEVAISSGENTHDFVLSSN